ncbi:MAG: 50S ribosomal protein L10, partial [SAR202 cluster bacterium]|nr:50S ribosomal protein L10 [SAR202 cluster bacterium]
MHPFVGGPGSVAQGLSFWRDTVPTQKKIDEVEELKKKVSESSIAISTNYSGQTVAAMTALRRTLREKGMDYRVVKNTLLGIAADGAGKSTLREIVNGPTGLVFGAGEPTEAAKVLMDYIKTSRSTLAVLGGVMDGRALSADEVQRLSELPSKPELIAKLLGQMQAPIASLVYVLSAPLTALVTIMHRRIEKGDAAPAPKAEAPAAAAKEAAPAAEAEKPAQAAAPEA